MTYGQRRILFVCTGNICRSPAAEVIARQNAASTALPNGGSLADVVTFISAGTASWHVGEPMDPRAAAALGRSGYDPAGHLAQHATDNLLSRSDLVLALDRKHHQILAGRLRSLKTTEGPQRLEMLRPFGYSDGAVDVADPYYGDEAGFDDCIAVVERSVNGLLLALTNEVTAR